MPGLRPSTTKLCVGNEPLRAVSPLPSPSLNLLRDEFLCAHNAKIRDPMELPVCGRWPQTSFPIELTSNARRFQGARTGLQPLENGATL